MDQSTSHTKPCEMRGFLVYWCYHWRGQDTNGGAVMAGGRPTSYDAKMPERALETIGDKGKSITQFARDMRVSRQTIYQWAEDHPEFSDALEKAKEWSEAHWEDRMEEFMVSKEVNAPLVKLYMANRFSWHDSQKLEHSGQIEQPLVVVLDGDDEEED